MPVNTRSNPPVTIFSTCKPFVGQSLVFQKNALTSWCHHDVPIMLMGDDDGTAEMATELGMQHVPEIRRNEKGTPLISDIFSKGISHSESRYLAYVNADIVITPTFWAHLEAALDLADNDDQPVFLTGRRRNLPLYDLMDWEKDGWDSLHELDSELGTWEPDSAIDLFLFSRDLFENIPDFAIGRMQWDNWLLWKAKDRGARIIDISLEAALYHPIHGYSDTSKGWQDITQGPEAVENRKLSQGHGLVLSQAVTDLYQEGRLLPYETHAAQLEKRLKADPIKELKAGSLYYERHSDDWDDTQVADFCRTILWRNQKFLSLDCPGHGDRKTIDILFQTCAKADRQQLHDQLNTIQSWLNKEFIDHLNHLKDRPIYIWGAGQAGQRAADFLARSHIHMAGFIDKNPQLLGSSLPWGNVAFCNVADLIRHHTGSRKPFIVPASLYAREIASELRAHGFVHASDYIA